MYGKVFTQMYDGTLATKGPWQALVTFQQLIVLANRHGEIDMTAEAISRRTTIPLEVINLGIEHLLQPDPQSRSPDEDGRRIVPLCEGRSWGWRIVNYGHYSKMQSDDERRAYHRDYMRMRRAPAAEKPAKPSPESTQQRATRLPDDWQPSAADMDFLQQTRPELSPVSVVGAFKDYWGAVPGAKGRKIDWPATWRNWVRNEKAPRKTVTGAPVNFGAAAKPWYIDSATAISAKGDELGVPQDDDWHAYRIAVFKAAGVTSEMVKKAEKDFK